MKLKFLSLSCVSFLRTNFCTPCSVLVVMEQQRKLAKDAMFTTAFSRSFESGNHLIRLKNGDNAFSFALSPKKVASLSSRTTTWYFLPFLHRTQEMLSKELGAKSLTMGDEEANLTINDKVEEFLGPLKPFDMPKDRISEARILFDFSNSRQGEGVRLCETLDIVLRVDAVNRDRLEKAVVEIAEWIAVCGITGWNEIQSLSKEVLQHLTSGDWKNVEQQYEYVEASKVFNLRFLLFHL